MNSSHVYGNCQSSNWDSSSKDRGGSYGEDENPELYLSMKSMKILKYSQHRSQKNNPRITVTSTKVKKSSNDQNYRETTLKRLSQTNVINMHPEPQVKRNSGFFKSRPNKDSTYDLKKNYVALFDFKARSKAELTMMRGDVLKIIDEQDDWLLAHNSKTLKQGYVPANHIAEVGKLEAAPWFVGALSRREAEMMLRNQSCQNGLFLVRRSENCSGLALSIVLKSFFKKISVKHYKVFQEEYGSFHLSQDRSFASLDELIAHHQKSAGILCCKLTKGFSKSKPPPIGSMSVNTWEVKREDFQLIDVLGSGNFGEVWKANWNQMVVVAVKILKPGQMEPDLFLEEANIMKTLQHPNIVKLMAVVSIEPIWIVTEYLSNGNLLDYLRSEEGNVATLEALLKMSYDIADGMTYLEKKNYIHRDLRAANVLVGEDKRCKVADFGLARLVADDEYKSSGSKCPMKWTAPEALEYRTFTVKSDVWSFGVLLSEIISKGKHPYPGIENHQVLSYLQQGGRMTKKSLNPECPNSIYSLMQNCWEMVPSKRPTFRDIRDSLDEKLSLMEEKQEEAKI